MSRFELILPRDQEVMSTVSMRTVWSALHEASWQTNVSSSETYHSSACLNGRCVGSRPELHACNRGSMRQS